MWNWFTVPYSRNLHTIVSNYTSIKINFKKEWKTYSHSSFKNLISEIFFTNLFTLKLMGK